MTNPSRAIPTTRLGQILAEEGRRHKWLADATGIHRVTLHHYINGRHVPEDRQRAIADALGRSVEDVFPEPTEAAA
jgi:hypothetical protein